MTFIPRPYKVLIGLVIFIYIIRLLCAVTIGIMPQDAYYFFYSEHLALSYFDHPPMVAYMLKLTSAIFGQSLLVVKMTDFLVSLIGLFVFYSLAKKFLSESRAVLATALYGATLQLTILSINTTPDVPLLLFWSLSLLVIYNALKSEKIKYWIVAGVLVGLTFNSKYTGVFLWAGLLLFLLSSKKHRKFLLSWHLLIMVIVFAITILPVVYWNIDNDWISFKFQSSERANKISRLQLQPLYFLSSVGMQLILIIPVAFILMWVILIKYIKKMLIKKRISEDTLFLLCFSVPIIVLFFAVSMFYWVKMNWMMPGYVTMFILLGIFMKRKWIKTHLLIALVIHFALLMQILLYPVNIKSDDTWYGWRDLVSEVKELQNIYPNHFLFSADGYKTAAVLNFYLDEHVYSRNVIGKPGLQFSIVDNDLSILEGRNGIYINSKTQFSDLNKFGQIPNYLSDKFEFVEELNPIIIKDRWSRPVRKFVIYDCQGYRELEPK